MKNIFSYSLKVGLVIILIILLIKLSKISFFNSSIEKEILIGVFAILFITVGIFLSRKYLYREVIREKNLIIEKQIIKEVLIDKPKFQINKKELDHLGISLREYKVLELISEGYSNREIGEKLFLSESTIKTHVSNLLVKLNARRRTEAVKVAKDLNIIK